MARKRPSLSDLFKQTRKYGRKEARIISSSLSPEVAGTFGGDMGEIGLNRANKRIGTLAGLLSEGDLDETQLGPNDQNLLSIYKKNHPNVVAKTKKDESGGSSFLGLGGPIGESLHNFWAGDNEIGLGAGPMAKAIPASLVMTGDAIADDIGNLAKTALNTARDVTSGGLSAVIPGSGLGPPSNTDVPKLETDAPGSQFVERIAKPVIKGYDEKYTEGGAGKIAENVLIKDPLGTLLDVLTLVSAGATGAAKTGGSIAKAGENLAQRNGRLGSVGERIQNTGQSMARTLSPEGRAPMILNPEATSKGAVAPEIGRRYSTRPVMKGAQKVMDKIIEDTKIGTGSLGPLSNRKIGDGNYITGRNLRETRDIWGGVKRTIIDRYGQSRAIGAMKKATESEPYMALAKEMSTPEHTALMFLKNGINNQRVRGTYTAIDSYRDYLARSLQGENPMGYNAGDLAELGVDTAYTEYLYKSLNDKEVLDLLNNPTDIMKRASDEWDNQVQRNLETQPIDMERHDLRTWGGQTILRVNPERVKRIAAEEGIEPHQLLSNPERMREIAGIRDPAGSFERWANQQDGITIRPNYTPQAIAAGTFSIKKSGALHFKQRRGKTTKRARAVEEHLEGAAALDAMKMSDFRTFLAGAMRLDPGVILEHIAQRERMIMNNGFLEEIVRELGAKIGDAEGDSKLATAKTREEMVQMGYSPEDYGLLHVDGTVRFYEDEVEVMKVLNETVSEMAAKSDADVAAGAQASLDSLNEYLEASGSAAALKLTSLAATKPDSVIMPKTAINYIRETFEAQQKSGTMFRQIMNVWRNFVLAYTPRWWLNTFVGSTMLTLMAGTKPRHLRSAWRYSKPERAVELMKKQPDLRYGLMGTEHMLEDRRRNVITDNWLTDKLYTGVENMEGFFKRAGFFKFLDDQAKQATREMGDVFEGMRSGIYRDEYIDNLLENHPQLVQGAMIDANKFFYNYNVLGTFERRYVRQFVPFWGWYKFITKLVWQLPAHYPGKVNAIQKVGEITDDMTDEEYGILPPSMVGAILLNRAANGEVEYIPTLGLNPFGDFVNPGEGMEGLLSAGQFSPFIQAGAAGFGLDSYRGTGIQSSPDSPFVTGLFGTKYDSRTGKEVQGAPGALSRIVGGGLRSLPILRTIEELQAGNKGVYSDSIPGVNVKPLPMEGTNWLETVMSNLGGSVSPRSKNLTDYQEWLISDLERGRNKRKTERKRLSDYGSR